ncbi:MAG: ornithine carbamoyltransferase [candidate division Zixibacteria bacterium]|nr:ornithine carbamoyltransferase [candidate division Zixibacteria bacterium]
MPRSLCQITDFSAAEIKEIFEITKRMKSGQDSSKPLEGKSVACIFTKASLRTRVSFEVGISQLGGNAVYITDAEIKLGQRESVADAARVLSRYISMIMIRTFKQSDVEEMAKYASVPIINGLTDLVHPCQILGDYFTVLEAKGEKDRFVVSYLGDANNITNSWLNLASLIPMELRIGTAEGFEPDAAILKRAKANADSKIVITHDPKEAIAAADVVYTDVWASMGQKHLGQEKAEKLKGFQLNSSLLAEANSDAMVLHCLPAERGKEITDEVMDGPQSKVFDQAENRLHIQKGIMKFLLN